MLMLMLLLRPPALASAARFSQPKLRKISGIVGSLVFLAPRFSHGVIAKQAALKDQQFRGRVNLYGAESPRAREAGADTPSFGQQTDPRSERPAGAACWPPSPIPF